VQWTTRPAEAVDLRGLYQQLLPLEFFWGALRQAQKREYNRVYHSGVVIWLMICQRLQAQGTLEKAVAELLAGLPESFWPDPCKRVEEALRPGGKRLSKQTGAYNRARQELSQAVVRQCFDHALGQLLAASPPQRQAFFVDGTTVRMPHDEELAKAYPPTRNQHGESHWPILRLLVAHDLHTGLALRPAFGAVNGDHAISEQALLEKVLQGVPAGALLVGDANFGIFSVAYAAKQSAHPTVLRLTTVRAMRLQGGKLQDGIEREITWRPTRGDRRTHPEIASDAQVSGRLIVRRVSPSNGAKPFLLALFTTLPEGVDEILHLYGKRWLIEVDLRHLKNTLRLEELTCTSQGMVAKEIDVAMLGYNLVRAVICATAWQQQLEPRTFSFTQVQTILQAFLPRIAAAESAATAEKLRADMQYYLGQCKLRPRQRASQPRAVWPKPKAYPSRH
jgi:hypothetical protein